MNYIYDILLNFNRQLYDFFEWNLNDNIIHVRKIPIYRIDSKALLDFRNHQIQLSHEFLDRIKNKTEIFTNKDVAIIEYATLVTDGSSVMAIKCNHEGCSCEKSFLLIDEDVEVLEVSNRLKENSISYEIIGNETYLPFQTRKVQKMIQFIRNELKKCKCKQAYEKLEYLYFECFGKCEDSIDKIISELYKQMNDENFFMIQKLYDFLKLTSVSK